jgi:hypothetical protein
MMPKRFLPIAVATLLSGCVLPIPSTLHVRGSVLDAKTKRPVVGARVTIQDHPKATGMTASDGSFDIPAETHWGFIVPPAEPVGLPDTVVITKDGYQAKTVRAAYEKHEIFLQPK